MRVGCIKHTHHAFDIDRPGKDSHTLRLAGARQVLIGSAERWALIVERPPAAGVSLPQMLERLDLAGLDLVLVEGFRLEPIPQIEIHRAELGAPPLGTGSASVIALASNQKPAPAVAVPVFDLDDPTALARFVLDHVARLSGLRPPGAND
jgi:molybdopterin-guanine dinucleotide biosynthesis protein B